MQGRINLGGGRNLSEAQNYFLLQNLNFKLKTFGFLNIRHKYKASTTLSFLQTKLVEKNIASKKSTFYYAVISI